MKFKDITLADVSTETKVETLGIVLDQKLEELSSTVYNVAKEKGEQGDRGEKGDKGDKGEQGIPGRDGKDGINGKDGKDGKDGDDGQEAPKIIDAEIAIDDTLLLTLSDGSQIKTTKQVVGERGAGGLNGSKGDKGDTGVGVPTGGTTGQVLSKIDSTDYNTQWVTPSGGSGAVTSVNTKTGAVVLTASDVGAEPADATILKSANIGVSVQAYDSDLTAWAGVSTTAKQDTLVSGTNIKTVNSNSLLGSGNISVGTVTSVTGTAPIASSGGNTPAISISQATTTTDGYLSSTDWNTFNNKQPAGTYVTSVGATSPVTSTGGTTPTIAIPAATSSVNGYLTSTDWTTFNSKGNGTVTSVGGTGTVSGISLSGTVTSSGNLTLGGALDLSSPPAIGGTAANTGSFTTLSCTSTSDTGALARNAGRTANTSITNQATFTTGGLTLLNQTAAVGSTWRIRAFGQFDARSNATARTAQVACFWGATQLVAITPSVLVSTLQTTQWQLEFNLTASSTTAIWTSGTLLSRIASATALAIDNAVPASTTVTAGAQTLDVRFRVTTGIANEGWIIQGLTIERLE